ncbi:unnamed protein product [Rotaria sordida]|uniref:Pentapeptide repeat-containing protein n=1 Tax=Rotaria sordida TaxID=392033 RepID=A0A819KPE3_9BILA|nr:unnamed protein product [Rotaria sordida]
MRRDLDLHIAELARRTDDLNAELQRNMSQEQRQHELEVEQQRYEKQMAIEHERYEQERIKYLAQLSLSYMNEISNLLEKTDGYLNSNPLTAALARAKTLNVIGQLGSNRSRQLIEFLHDAKQMTTDDKPLDLSGAQLNKLDFRGSSALHTRKKLSLVGISLNEATFEGLQIDGWDFTAASLNGANFRYCNISNTMFDQTSLIGADFSFSQLDLIIFNYAQVRLESWTQQPANGLIIRRESSINHECVYSAKKDARAALIQKVSLICRCSYGKSTIRQTMTELRDNYEKAQQKLETADANLKMFLFLLFKIKNVLIILLRFHTRSDRLILANFDERLRELEDIRCEYEQSRTLSRDIYATET